jgi:single stranded DNA-binding protein
MATISLVGRIAGNFKSTQLENGNYCISASIAENNKRKDGQEYAEWYQVSLFSKSNALEKYMEKGARVYVVGKLTFSEYTDQRTGHCFYHKNINADTFDLLDWKKIEQEDHPQSENQTSNG